MLVNNIKYFLAIVEFCNISKAAQKLGISQPSLSKYLKKLEDSLGVELVYRKSTKLELTYAGELYLSYLQEADVREKKLKQSIVDIKESTTGKLVIGITSWRSAVFLPKVLSTFYKKYPYISIELKEGSHKHLFQLMNKHEVDFCIVSVLPETHNYVTYHLNTERVLLATNKNLDVLKANNIVYNPKRKKLTSVDFKLFADEPIIQLKLGQYLRTEVDTFLAKNKFNNRMILETENIITAVNMAAEGIGITFVPEQYIYSEQRNKNLAFFNIQNYPIVWQLTLVHHVDFYPNKNFRLFIEHIKKMDW